MNSLTLACQPLTHYLLPTDQRVIQTRLRAYLTYTTEIEHAPWFVPDLAGFARWMLERGYKPSSAQVYVSSVRSLFKRLLRDRDTLWALIPDLYDAPADRKALFDELVARIENALHDPAAAVSVTTHQDFDERAFIRLTVEQVIELVSLPGIATLKGLRDTAILSVLLTTGIREAELSNLDVDDLYGLLGEEPALVVRQGKGDKARLVPYGDNLWAREAAEHWLSWAGIERGPVFRGFYRGYGSIRPGRLSVRAIENILAEYPLSVDGHTVRVRPHDCRRTYARLMYEAGMELVAIQQNLGHSDLKTTMRYIGSLDAERRRGRGMFGAVD